jgi:hypothetical protein
MKQCTKLPLPLDQLTAQYGPQVGFDYAISGPAGHWQALCPACKRKSLAMAQMRIRESARG